MLNSTIQVVLLTQLNASIPTTLKSIYNFNTTFYTDYTANFFFFKKITLKTCCNNINYIDISLTFNIKFVMSMNLHVNTTHCLKP